MASLHPDGNIEQNVNQIPLEGPDETISLDEVSFAIDTRENTE